MQSGLQLLPAGAETPWTSTWLGCSAEYKKLERQISALHYWKGELNTHLLLTKADAETDLEVSISLLW